MYFTNDVGEVMRSHQTVVDGGWSAWESLGGSAVGEPIVGHHDDGRLQVFIFQADGGMWGKSQASGGGWGDWTALGPPLFEDLMPPVISSIDVYTWISAPGDPVQVEVIASDNVEVEAVTANGLPLTDNGGGNWSGSAPAEAALGWHSVVVEARDTSDNTSTNAEHGYTTVPVYSLINRGIFDQIMSDAQSKFVFMIWGRVTVLDGDSFTLDDGSHKPVTVYATNHGLTTGQYATARGFLQWISPTDVCMGSSTALVQVVD